MNNVVRVAYQALAAVLAGTQSLHTNSLDETLALPTEQSAKLALRTQQVLAHETGVPNVVDPLGGSYYVEALTDKMENGAEDLFREIEEIGGVVTGIENGWFQQKIAQSAAKLQQEVDQKRRVVVGVNDFVDESEGELDILHVSDEAEAIQLKRMAELRQRRDNGEVKRTLAALKQAAEREENVIPSMLDCARCYSTLYEIRYSLEEVYGAFREPIFF